MLTRSEYAWPGTDADLMRLVAAHPWVTLVSATSRGLVVSPLPAIPDPDDAHGDRQLAAVMRAGGIPSREGER